MKRINIIPIIITLCLALAFFAAAIALLFIPEPKPLKITEKPTVEYVDGEYVVHGKIKNVSGKEIILRAYGFRAEVSAINESGNNMTYTIKPYDDIAVQPDEEIALSFLHAKLGTLQNAKINKIIFTPEHTDITVYGNVINNGNFAICALFTGIAGAGLLIISIASSVTAKRNAKRVNNIIAQMRQSFENAAYCGGYYGSKSQNRTAAAKTAASVLGAVISALFLGLGKYKVYSNGGKREFIITDNAIYMNANGKFCSITDEIKATFTNPAVTQNKGRIHVKGEDKNVYLIVCADKPDRERTLNNLKSIFTNTAQAENTQGQSNGKAT